MKILGIVGSKRKDGNTAYLVEKALDEIKCKEIETEIIFLSDYNIGGCTGCEACKDTYKCVINDDMQKLYPLIMEADAIVMGSPTYFYNVSSDIKAFIERCYCFQVFADNDRSVWSSINEALGGKYAIVIAICEQDNKRDMGFTGEAMSQPLEALGYRVVETVKILKLYKRGEALENQVAIDQVKRAGKKLKKTVELRKKTEKMIKSN